MRIIKVGKKPNPEKIKICSKCKTEFAYTSSDVKIDQLHGNYVNCPVCNSYIADQ